MASQELSSVVQHLRRIVLTRDTESKTDAELLDRFLTRREETAFAALLRRHGPMVLGVCRRVLRDPHDAEDAFQATFLVLVRKAATISRRELVGNWLYGVAYRTALEARTAAVRRRLRERQVHAMPETPFTPQESWNDLQPVLDQELHRLPDRYRGPLVLCDLEGKSRKEAARELGCPEGTLSSRLARARALLAERLARHGLTLSGGALALVMSQEAARASVPLPLLVSTVEVATTVAAGSAAATALIPGRVAALTERMMRVMLLTRLKIATAVLLAAGLFAIGIAARAYQDQPPPGGKDEKAFPPINRPQEAPAQKKNLIALDLPTTPMPGQAYISMGGKGDQLVVRDKVISYQPVERVGKKITDFKKVDTERLRAFDLAQVKIHDSHGKKLDAKAVRKLLKGEKLALVYPDGQDLDPLHLRVIKEGTLVVVLPASPNPFNVPGIELLPAPGAPAPPGGQKAPPPHGIEPPPDQPPAPGAPAPPGGEVPPPATEPAGDQPPAEAVPPPPPPKPNQP
jgi:RNA polymerase sigma factor (sigma-70 family)